MISLFPARERLRAGMILMISGIFLWIPAIVLPFTPLHACAWFFEASRAASVNCLGSPPTIHAARRRQVVSVQGGQCNPASLAEVSTWTEAPATQLVVQGAYPKSNGRCGA